MPWLLDLIDSIYWTKAPNYLEATSIYFSQMYHTCIAQSIGLFGGGGGGGGAFPVLNATWFFLFDFSNCVLLCDYKTDTRMIVTIGIHFKQHFYTK